MIKEAKLDFVTYRLAIQLLSPSTNETEISKKWKFYTHIMRSAKAQGNILFLGDAPSTHYGFSLAQELCNSGYWIYQSDISFANEERDKGMKIYDLTNMGILPYLDNFFI